MRAGDCRRVRAVFDNDQEVEFTKNGDEWEGEVHTDPRGGGQLRIVMEDARTRKDVHLLTYNVSFITSELYRVIFTEKLRRKNVKINIA